MVDWNNADNNTVKMAHAIARRAREYQIVTGSTLPLEMDITAAAIAISMDLDALYNADEFNFCHDVLGIMKHIDRETGKMKNCFVPRFAI